MNDKTYLQLLVHQESIYPVFSPSRQQCFELCQHHYITLSNILNARKQADTSVIKDNNILFAIVWL